MSSELWYETLGAGPDLVMVPGWAMHSGIWREFAEGLSLEFRVTLVDLPGIGRSAGWQGGRDLEALAEAVDAVAPADASWLGWSLGGMVCQHLAVTRPQRVARLINLCSSPRFCRGEGWPHAQEAAVLEQFARDLEYDYAGTLQRFLALEVRGSDHARDELRLLRQRLFDQGEPDTAALGAGLDILRYGDLRSSLGAIEAPTCWIFGERDNLVPASAAADIGALQPGARQAVIPGAGHAPFLSHPNDLLREVSRFLYD